MPGGEESSSSALAMVYLAHMTTQISLPGKFDEANSPQAADAWPKWLCWFDRYRVESGLNNKPQTEQVSTLLNAMGDSADDILQTLQLNKGTVSYQEIKKSLNDYFHKRQNVIVERAHFNKRSQIAGESVDTFIQDLYRLADNYDYGALKDSLIWDRIVVGVLDDSLPTRLHLKASLTPAQTVQSNRSLVLSRKGCVALVLITGMDGEISDVAQKILILKPNSPHCSVAWERWRLKFT